MKIEASQELVVAASTVRRQARRARRPALGYYAGDDLVFAARSAPASTPALFQLLRAARRASRASCSPFTIATGLPKLRVHWVEPQVVVQVGFMQWTGNNKLRRRACSACATTRPRARWSRAAVAPCGTTTRSRANAVVRIGRTCAPASVEAIAG